MPTLLSVNVGLPEHVSWQGRTVHTGIWKYSVPGRRMARRLNLDGDGQGDLRGHGGEMRAVLVYQIQSYDHWKEHLGRDDFVYGQFGENLTVDGLSDDEVCVGDRYRIGEAEFEVTQPRVTCYRLGVRMDRPDMPNLLVSHHRPGFYMRVVTEGYVEAGDLIVRTAAGPGRLSVADTDALLYLPDRDIEKVRTALTIPALSPGWRDSFQDLLATADNGASAARPIVAEPGWIGFRRLRVTRVVAETDTVHSVCLQADDGEPLPPARAGEYLTVRATGAGQPAPVRSYSLSSAPGAATYRISIKREIHGVVSAYLHATLEPGTVLDAAAPRGDFVLDDGDRLVVLVSAGIGVTPVLAMLHQLADQGTEREVWWIHAARGPAEHVFAAEAHDLLGALPHGHEQIYYTQGTHAEVRAAGATSARLTADRLRDLDLPADATAYVCGPTAFMVAMHDGLAAAGIPSDRIYSETFGALGAINPGLTDSIRPAPHLPPGEPGFGPLVTFARSGLSVPFDPADRRVLELADRCDVPTRWSCRTGGCHTCATPLLDGRVSYSPEPLEPPTDGEVLICCARPDTALVLDM